MKHVASTWAAYRRLRGVDVEEHLGACREIREDRVNGLSRRLILFLGEDNPQSSRPEFALFDRPVNVAGERLRTKILALDQDDYLATWRTNLCNPRWNRADALHRAAQVIAPDLPWRAVFLLGKRVQDVVRRVHGIDVPPFEHRTLAFSEGRGSIVVACLPHPSVRCQVWNDPLAPINARRLHSDVVRLVAGTANAEVA